MFSLITFQSLFYHRALPLCWVWPFLFHTSPPLFVHPCQLFSNTATLCIHDNIETHYFQELKQHFTPVATRVYSSIRTEMATSISGDNVNPQNEMGSSADWSPLCWGLRCNVDGLDRAGGRGNWSRCGRVNSRGRHDQKPLQLGGVCRWRTLLCHHGLL